MKPVPPTIRIRLDNLSIARATAGLNSDTALAQVMGLHPTTVKRTLTGQAQLGTAFIAALLATFPGVGFDRLFEVGADVDNRAAQAMSA